jgi:hypothetical protein
MRATRFCGVLVGMGWNRETEMIEEFSFDALIHHWASAQ